MARAAEDWIKAVKIGRADRDRGPAEPATLRQYRYHLDHYILPALGREKLSKLTKERVKKFRADLLGKISRALARKVLTSLKGLLNEAVDSKKLALNPAAGIKVGFSEEEAEEVVIPEKKDIGRLLVELDRRAEQDSQQRAASWRRRRAMVATAIHTGVRASELRGLPWSAIDFKAGKITISQKADENGTVKRKTKSKAGKREINIPTELVAILKDWRGDRVPTGLVFPTSTGRPENHANIHNRCWRPLLKATGLAGKEYEWHHLRHFHASMLIDAGANPKEVMVEMGHSSIKITYDLYGHLFRDEAADKARAARADLMASKLR